MVLLLMAIGAAWLAALCRHAIPVVYVTVAMIPLSWFLGAATAAQQGNAPSAAVFVACGLLSLLWLRCVRRKLELTAALIKLGFQDKVTLSSFDTNNDGKIDLSEGEAGLSPELREAIMAKAE